MRVGLVLLLFTLLGACPAPGRGAPRSVTDDLGRRLTLPAAPSRIVSLAPSVTEILFAVGAQGRLVGDTALCDFPAAARRLPHVGGVVDPSDERVVALLPDLIVVASQTLSPAEADRMAARWHAPVFVTAAADYAGVVRDVATLGALVGHPGPTRQTLRRMRAARQAVRRAIAGSPRPRVFVLIWDDPLMTATGASFIGDLVRITGGVNVAERVPGPYPLYAPERLVTADPDVILVEVPGTATRRVSRPLFDRLRLRAARAGRVWGVPDDWVTRPGPRLALALAAIAHVLHPEAFAK